MIIPRIKIVEDGVVVVSDAFVFNFFLNETHKTLVSRAEDVLGAYLAFVGLDSVPYRLDEDGEIEELKSITIQGIQRELFHNDSITDNSVIRLVGAIDDQTGYGFEYVGDDLPDVRLPNLRNLISIRLPTLFCTQLGWDAIYKFGVSISDLLPYTYGYGSPCLAYYDIRDVVGLAFKYPGLDIAAAMACRVDIGEKILGAYWLSFLGQSLSQSLGGIGALAGKLHEPINVKALDESGAVIRLGDAPEFGDVNRMREMPLYRRFSEVIADELHIPKSVYFADSSGLRDKEAMIAWHRRFLIPN